jgi:calcineurin-like phosphoesterase family protein
MTTWFTSDWHLGHKNILHFGTGRPFASIAEHDAELVRRHNALVDPDDEVWVLGDVAMGKIEESFALCAQMNGRKNLVCGNHDRPAMTSDLEKRAKWAQRYKLEGGFSLVIPAELTQWELGLPSGQEVLLSHYPYSGDSQETERYLDRRPVDSGGWLLHGHVHEAWRQRGKMINVGVDVWNYSPVAATTLEALITSPG